MTIIKDTLLIIDISCDRNIGYLDPTCFFLSQVLLDKKVNDLHKFKNQTDSKLQSNLRIAYSI